MGFPNDGAQAGAGRVAGPHRHPLQEEVHRFEGRPYDPSRFLQPEDVAASVIQALRLPRTAELTDLHIRPMRG